MRRNRAANAWPCSLSVTTTTRKPFIDLMTRPFTFHSSQSLLRLHKPHTSNGGQAHRYILLLSVLFETTPLAEPNNRQFTRWGNYERTCCICARTFDTYVVGCRTLSPYAIAASCKSASVDLNSYRGLLISLDCDFRDVRGVMSLHVIDTASCLSSAETAFNINAIPPQTRGA